MTKLIPWFFLLLAVPAFIQMRFRADKMRWTFRHCLFFWVCLVGHWITRLLLSDDVPSAIIFVGCLIGGLMNATVMLANGGYMPVTKITKETGVWRAARPTDRLLMLCDRFAGYSLGDFLLIASCFGSVIAAVMQVPQ